MSTFIRIEDLNGVVLDCKQPLRESEVCLACLHRDGRLELLTGAWESVLGFTQVELHGRSLDSLLSGGRAATRAVLQQLLDPLAADPVPIEVRVKSGARRTLLVHRNFDPYEPSVYLACEPFDDPGKLRSSASVSALSTS